jgi:hypothetical protein
MFQPYACESLLLYVPECDQNGLFLLSCLKGFYGIEFAKDEITLFFWESWSFLSDSCRKRHY